jgi:carbonic anhydrase
MQHPITIAVGLAAAGTASAFSLARAETHHPHHWSYSGKESPSHWAELDAQYRLCAAGKRQSPINIHTNAVYRSELSPLEFDYRPSPLHIIDNGHTIQADYGHGSSLLVGGHRYQLVQIHFHHPSEEEIDGKRFDMVAHLVHRDAAGKLAVVAVLLKVGHENPLLGSLWSHLPKAGDHSEASPTIDIDARQLIPADHGYFTFTGSLTTPPCSEGVRWLVLKTPMEISDAQLAVFAGRYPDDARPIQRLNGRHISATK